MNNRDWHFVDGNTSAGPYSAQQIEGMIGDGRITAQTLVWTDNMPQWEPAALHFSGFVQPSVSPLDGLYDGAPSRGFVEATQVCLRKYATFRGRASRSEYWFFVLFGALAGTIASVLDLVVFGLADELGILNGLVSLGIFLPSLAVSVRRLHDTNRSGWWIGWFYLVVGALIVAAGFAVFDDTFVNQIERWGPMIGFVVLGVLVYTIVMLVFFCLRGTPGPNRFG